MTRTDKFKYCTCIKCGWVHIAYTRGQAIDSVNKFNSWYNQQNDKTKSYYAGPSSLDDYKCRCGSEEFRAFKKGDCPDHVTVSPVIWEEKE